MCRQINPTFLKKIANFGLIFESDDEDGDESDIDENAYF